MGSRVQVRIKDTGVYLYSHWTASYIIKDIRRALKKHWRWDDPMYLTRIIFDEISSEVHMEETGFGISTNKQEDIELLITINVNKQTIKSEYLDGEIGDKDNRDFKCSFEEFIEMED